MKQWKAILAALVIFAAGAVTGSLTWRMYLQPPPPTPRSSPAFNGPRPPRDLIGRMQKELALTPTQRERIEQYLRESQEQTRQLWESIAPQAGEVHRKLRERIRSELTEEQQKRYEEVFKPRGSNRPPDTKNREGWRDHGPRSNGAPESPEQRPPARP